MSTLTTTTTIKRRFLRRRKKRVENVKRRGTSFFTFLRENVFRQPELNYNQTQNGSKQFYRIPSPLNDQ
jgi:hypothetical protein